MKKILLLFIAALAVISVKAIDLEDGKYHFYAWDKTGNADVDIVLSTTDNDIYYATGNALTSSDLSSIKVIYGNWETEYAPAADTWPEVTVDGDAISLVSGGTGSGWIYGWTLASTDYIFFQLSTLKVAITSDSTCPFTSATAIKKVSVEDNGVAEYYNLQGARVSNPSKGLYIKKQGGKSTKILVR